MVDPENESTAPIELGIAAFLMTPYIAFYMLACHWEVLGGQPAIHIIWAQMVGVAFGCLMMWFCRSPRTVNTAFVAEKT